MWDYHFWFSVASYISWPIRLQDFFNINISEMNQCIQMYLSSNQIAGFFDHQYLWKKFNNLLDFLNGDSHQAKEERLWLLIGWG